jgi:hypothetical protein
MIPKFLQPESWPFASVEVIRDETHALPYGTQGKPRTLEYALCGVFIQIHEDAGHQATCPTCIRLQAEYDALDLGQDDPGPGRLP